MPQDMVLCISSVASTADREEPQRATHRMLHVQGCGTPPFPGQTAQRCLRLPTSGVKGKDRSGRYSACRPRASRQQTACVSATWLPTAGQHDRLTWHWIPFVTTRDSTSKPECAQPARWRDPSARCRRRKCAPAAGGCHRATVTAPSTLHKRRAQAAVSAVITDPSAGCPTVNGKE